jgi:hypothetical protein
MGANTAAAIPSVAADDVMASIDDDGTEKEFVIADISRDDSWITIPLKEAATLPNWR